MEVKIEKKYWMDIDPITMEKTATISVSLVMDIRDVENTISIVDLKKLMNDLLKIGKKRRWWDNRILTWYPPNLSPSKIWWEGQVQEKVGSPYHADKLLDRIEKEIKTIMDGLHKRLVDYVWHKTTADQWRGRATQTIEV